MHVYVHIVVDLFLRKALIFGFLVSGLVRRYFPLIVFNFSLATHLTHATTQVDCNVPGR